jgi:hypothetical protein
MRKAHKRGALLSPCPAAMRNRLALYAIGLHMRAYRPCRHPIHLQLCPIDLQPGAIEPHGRAGNVHGRASNLRRRASNLQRCATNARNRASNV